MDNKEKQMKSFKITFWKSGRVSECREYHTLTAPNEYLAKVFAEFYIEMLNLGKIHESTFNGKKYYFEYKFEKLEEVIKEKDATK